MENKICQNTNIVQMENETNLGTKNIQMERGISQSAKIVQIENRVVDILLMCGMSPSLSGYIYLKEGIKNAISNPLNVSNLSKFLYPLIANKFNTTISRVERGIRHALENAYNKGRISRLNNEFKVDIFEKYEKPTNAEFVAIVADKIALEMFY